MINKNGGLFYGTLIDRTPLSAVLVDVNGNLTGENVTCSNSLTSGNNTYADTNNLFGYTLRRTFARIGYGNTLPTINDYCLEQEELNGVNINNIIYCGGAYGNYTLYNPASTTSSYEGKASDGTMCYAFTFYNNTNSDVTFYEIGLFVNTQISAPTYPFMTARCVNPNGWTIKARENITLVIEMDFACGKGILKQGSRYFTSAFSVGVGQYGYINYLGNEIQGTSSLRPTGTGANSNATRNNAYSDSNNGIFARLGVGQTAVTPTDYCMENEILASEDNINDVVECSSGTLYTNRTGGGNGKWVYSYTFSNSTSSDIVAYEIGLFCRDVGGTYMIGREVNETGWTFPAGSTKTINFEIEICGATNDMERPINNG